MKKIIKVLGSIFVLCMVILFFNGCDNDGVNGTYYELKGKKLDKSSYFVLKNEKWSNNDELSGTYKLDGDNIILYLSSLEYTVELDNGTLFNGVLKLEEFGTYCIKGSAKDYMIDQTELKYEKNNDSYIVTGIKSKDIKSIVIPSTYNNLPVTEIKDSAFKDFTLLKDITLPSSIEHIGKYAFANCTSLTEVNYLGTIKDWCNIKFDSIESNPLFNAKTLMINDEEVTEITEEMLEGLTSIPEYAFSGCISIKSITFPSSIQSIEGCAFEYCTSLTYITIPSSVQSIGEFAFYNCDSIFEVNYLGTIKDWCNIKFSMVTSSPLLNASLNTLRINGEIITEITEEMLEGVTSIPDYAFKGCISLTSITIPSSVQSIGISAFYGCTSLINLIIPSSVQIIENDAFCNCTSLKSITIPSSVKLIDAFAFNNCKSLKEFNYLGTIKDWCNLEFRVNPIIFLYNVKSYKINGQEVTDITEITEEMLEGVTSIPDYAFYNFTSLKKITIPSSVQIIEDQAFYNCTSLTSIIIPLSIERIKFDVFHNCTSLKIYCEAEWEPSYWRDDWNYSNIPVYWKNEWHYENGVPTPNK